MRLPAQSTRVGQVSYRRGTPGQPGLPPSLLGVHELHSRAGIQNVYSLHGKFVLPTWNAVIIISYIIRVHCKHENALAKGDGEVAGMYYNL